MKELSNQLKDYKIPILIGVTGHRDLIEKDCERLTIEVKEVLENTMSNYSSTPIYLLSPLAEGADRLVAKVALELGIKLIVPMTMPKDDFIKDFNSEASIIEFEELLNQAEFSIDLPVHYTDKEKKNIDREKQYVEVGIFIVLYSQIILGLWDGKPSDFNCGTYSIIQFALNNIPIEYRNVNFMNTQNNIIYHISTQRQSNLFEPCNTRIIVKNEIKQDVLYKLKNINSLNKDVELKYNSIKEKIEQEISSFLNKEETKRNELVNKFGVISAMANKYDSNWLIKIIFSLVVTAIVFLCIFANIAVTITFLSIYLLIFGMAFLFSVLANKNNIKKLNYRAISEALRIQLYWNSTGIKNLDFILNNIGNEYKNHYRKKINWVITVQEILSIFAYKNYNKSDVTIDNINEVLDSWVYGQFQYFKKALAKKRKIYKNIKIGSFYLLLAGILTTFIVLITNIYWENVFIDYQPYFLFAMALFPGIGGALSWLEQKLSYNEEINMYEEMMETYRIAIDELNNCIKKNDIITANNILYTLGRESLEENCRWVSLHLDRKIDVPH